MLELRHLRHFVAVAEELHFARAAERLSMEQSPLSQSIRNLETQLGVKLFQRSTRRTWLTGAGTRFLRDARRILADVDAATSAARSDDKESPDVVRLALGENLAGGPFTRLLFELEHHSPPLTVDVRELSQTDATRLVRDNGADVALMLDGRETDGLQRRRAWAEPLMLVAPIGHPLAERDHVELSEIAIERLAVPEPDICPGYLAQIEDLFGRHNLSVGKRVSVRHWNTGISFAATGKAVALCPASFVNGATTVTVIPIAARDAELVTWLFYPETDESSAASLVVEVAALIDRDPKFFAAVVPDC